MGDSARSESAAGSSIGLTDPLRDRPPLIDLLRAQ